MGQEFKDERLQKIYDDGFSLGFTYGPSKRINNLIGKSDSPALIESMSTQEIVIEIITSCSELGATVPGTLLEDLTTKEVQVFLFGYVHGKQKNIRNRADRKYHEKIGFVSKSYKLHEDVVVAFAEACKVSGVSLSSALERLMLEFVEEVISK